MLSNVLVSNILGWIGLIIVVALALPIILGWLLVLLSIVTVMSAVVLFVMVFMFVFETVGDAYRWFKRTAGVQ